MSSGLSSGVSGLALGTGLFRNVSGLWGGSSGLIAGFDGNSRLEWNSTTDTYSQLLYTGFGNRPWLEMRRCLLNLNGTVNYYLDPNNSTLKADGTPANLTGADGYVMVEIPRFYFKYERIGDRNIWSVRSTPEPDYAIHPAFIKDGVEVDRRYMGAYDACFWDATDGLYKSGLNLDNSDTLIDIAADRLASVAGVYPLVGQTRARFRTLATNNGPGWRQQDFWLTSAVQLLYLVENGTFNSQLRLGAGNTNGSYLVSSAVQTDSPHTIAGASNGWGNASTNGTQPSAGAKPGTAYMSYRGIENLFGNCWSFVDGLNILTDYQAWATNDSQFFVDNVSTGMAFLGVTGNTNGFVTNIVNTPGAFLPTTVGGSSSTFLTDNYFQATGNRVALLGGNASNGASAGAFFWGLFDSSGARTRSIGARVCY